MLTFPITVICRAQTPPQATQRGGAGPGFSPFLSLQIQLFQLLFGTKSIILMYLMYF